MKFRNFEEALGSKVNMKVLLYLLEERLPTSEREIAKVLGVSHMAVNRAMKIFFELNLVSPLRVGNVHLWKLKEDSYAYMVLKPLAYLAKNPPLTHLKSEIRSTLGSYTGVKKVILFGSVAERREQPNSDIDLLVIVEKEEQKRSIRAALSSLGEKCLAWYGNVLSPFILTEKESRAQKYKHLLKGAERGMAII